VARRHYKRSRAQGRQDHTSSAGRPQIEKSSLEAIDKRHSITERDVERRSTVHEARVPRLWRLVVAASVGVTLLSGYCTLRPRLTLTPPAHVELTEPYREPFVLRNDGVWPIEAMSVQCSTITYHNTRLDPRIICLLTFMKPEAIGALSPGDMSPVRCASNVSQPELVIAKGTLQLTQTYRLRYLPFSFTEHRSFETIYTAASTVAWASCVGCREEDFRLPEGAHPFKASREPQTIDITLSDLKTRDPQPPVDLKR
jgi:hypothetical protein